MQEDTLNLSVSQVFHKNGKKYAFVSFDGAGRHAEGRIPDCTLTVNEGFSSEEAAQLEQYMKKELSRLKKMAAGVNVLHAFMEK